VTRNFIFVSQEATYVPHLPKCSLPIDPHMINRDTFLPSSNSTMNTLRAFDSLLGSRSRLMTEPWRSVFVAIDAVQRRSREKKSRKVKRKQRARNRHLVRPYNPLSFSPLLIEQRSDYEFKKMFRMDRANFEVLFSQLEPYLPDVNQEMARRSSGSFISKRSKVMCCIRFLAGASYHDLMVTYGVSKSVLWDAPFC